MVAATIHGFRLIPLPPLLWTPAPAVLRPGGWRDLAGKDPHPDAARVVAQLMEDAADARH